MAKETIRTAPFMHAGGAVTAPRPAADEDPSVAAGCGGDFPRCAWRRTPSHSPPRRRRWCGRCRCRPEEGGHRETERSLTAGVAAPPPGPRGPASGRVAAKGHRARASSCAARAVTPGRAALPPSGP
jgi:hypothetical protein